MGCVEREMGCVEREKGCVEREKGCVEREMEVLPSKHSLLSLILVEPNFLLISSLTVMNSQPF